MERKIGLLSIIIGALWIAFSITALILGLRFVGGIENTVLGPVDFIHDSVVKSVDTARAIDVLKVFERPLLNLRSSIERPLLDFRTSIQHAFTTVKLVYAGLTVWLALPQILLIYAGYLLRKGTFGKGR